MLRTSQWHSFRISSTSWMARCRNPGGRPGRIGLQRSGRRCSLGRASQRASRMAWRGMSLSASATATQAADQVLRTDHAVIDDLLLLCLSGGDLSLFLLKE